MATLTNAAPSSGNVTTPSISSEEVFVTIITASIIAIILLMILVGIYIYYMHCRRTNNNHNDNNNHQRKYTSLKSRSSVKHQEGEPKRTNDEENNSELIKSLLIGH